jgi:hypothetical protein
MPGFLPLSLLWPVLLCQDRAWKRRSAPLAIDRYQAFPAPLRIDHVPLCLKYSSVWPQPGQSYRAAREPVTVEPSPAIPGRPCPLSGFITSMIHFISAPQLGQGFRSSDMDSLMQLREIAWVPSSTLGESRTITKAVSQWQAPREGDLLAYVCADVSQGWRGPSAASAILLRR